MWLDQLWLTVAWQHKQIIFQRHNIHLLLIQMLLHWIVAWKFGTSPFSSLPTSNQWEERTQNTNTEIIVCEITKTDQTLAEKFQTPLVIVRRSLGKQVFRVFKEKFPLCCIHTPLTTINNALFLFLTLFFCSCFILLNTSSILISWYHVWDVLSSAKPSKVNIRFWYQRIKLCGRLELPFYSSLNIFTGRNPS